MTELKEKKTILIFGISSFIGSNLAVFLKNDFKIVGTYYKTPTEIPGVLCLPCDVLNKESVQLALYTSKADYTIYCIGLNSVVYCSEADGLADALNASGLFNVAEMCQRYKSQICYISQDFVFSGEDKDYLEMDIPDSMTVLGKTKASGEFYIQKNSLNYMIFRTCHLYGRHINPQKRTFFENLQYNINSSSPQSFDCYVKQGYLDVYYLCLIIKLSIERKAQNRLIHLCSKDIMSRYEFAKLYCKVFNENAGQVNKGRWPYPLLKLREGTEEFWYYKLNSDNLESFLNIYMPSVEESLDLTLRRYNGSNSIKHNKNQGSSISFI
ncbi:MAG: SDR family oxidoreductase [Bacteriovoracaceae bacterium]